jgi:hypothetical protein
LKNGMILSVIVAIPSPPRWEHDRALSHRRLGAEPDVNSVGLSASGRLFNIGHSPMRFRGQPAPQQPASHTPVSEQNVPGKREQVALGR